MLQEVAEPVAQPARQFGNWLAASFPNLYGADAGERNLAGLTNREVADFYRGLFRQDKRSAAQAGRPGSSRVALSVRL